jgi:hypothetical protein
MTILSIYPSKRPHTGTLFSILSFPSTHTQKKEKKIENPESKREIN